MSTPRDTISSLVLEGQTVFNIRSKMAKAGGMTSAVMDLGDRRVVKVNVFEP